jgi:hypothetical protein
MVNTIMAAPIDSLGRCLCQVEVWGEFIRRGEAFASLIVTP